MAQTVKCLPTVWGTWVRSLGQEDPLEKEMAPHSSTLAWKIPWTEKPGGLQSMIAKSRTRLSDFTIAIQSYLRKLGKSQINSLTLTHKVAQRVKRLPAMWETWVRSLGQEDPLEKELAPHSSTLAWKIPWTEKPGGLQSMIAKSRTRLSDFPFTF